MLKKATVEELADIFALCVNNINSLTKHCSGIIKNELKATYDTDQDQANQQTLKQSIENIATKIISTVNEALRTENSEKLRNGLVNFFSAVQGAFQASLEIHLAHDFDQEKGEKRSIGHYFDHEQGDKQAKGRYFEIHRSMIALCERAKATIRQDHDLKGEFGHMSVLTESLNATIKSLSEIFGYKTKASKKEKIVELTKPAKSFHEEFVSPYERRTSPK
ncbi:MAG: hypothetical protein BGO43_09410 [Gammaproteobacteria bacterium 39-13]|jgi:hypothetical protein|nr:hypothetical protein [Gammaproteobacteria bacterium]OJV93859.1 MAG: hypothetical protein BGO43_09410 [Gammaproteobacteria bacterium 39-13]